MAAQLGAGGELCVPVFVGSPRYLLLRQLLPAHLRLPPELLLADGAACRLHYRVGLGVTAGTVSIGSGSRCTQGRWLKPKHGSMWPPALSACFKLLPNNQPSKKG